MKRNDLRKVEFWDELPSEHDFDPDEINEDYEEATRKYTGYFHEWSQDEIWSSKLKEYYISKVALIETYNGEIRKIQPEKFKFIDNI